MENTNQILQDDLLQYRKNSLPANLTLLGLIFNVLFFCIAYCITAPTTASGDPSLFVTILMGGSVILTLVMLLTTFLASEGIKAYKKKFVVVLIVLAVIQFARIFVFPIYVLQHQEFVRTYFWIRTGNSTILGVMMIFWQCLSVACYVAAAVIGYRNCKKREDHVKAVENGEINMEQIFAEDKKQIEAGAEPIGSVAEEVK